ncbi:sulfite exporter TauE/SafE family protein [Bacterioplanoides sp.]|uniref:urease accessory protein UreH domain-containing protein n=1 Tax=Bacterioplanoides sp. TaxID=2066072 RepID=UPI003B5A02FD
MTPELMTLLFTGLGLGLLHALDADHVMAVSALSNRKPDLRRTLKFSANWAIGHGSVLLILGMLLFGLGVSLPESIQHIAESSVGVLLIILGLVCFWQFHKEKLSVTTHSHGDIRHTHIQLDGHEQVPQNQIKEAHTPVMVGVLHGLAGSAPALALIPAMIQAETGTALAYLLLFSAGVLVSMVTFGLLFGQMQKQLQQKSIRLFTMCRQIIAGAAIAIGGFWLYQAI